MKILQVCSAESLGGGERHVAELTRALVERGHTLHLVVRPQSPLHVILADWPVEWHVVGLRNALDWASARRLSAIIREQDIEVLHAHVARDYTVCGLAAKLAPTRFFLTRHHFNPIKSNLLYAWALSDAAGLIAVSESVRAKLITAFPSLASRIVVIPNWIDPRMCGRLSREEGRARLGLTRRLAVGIIGQLTPLKRQDLFIRAAASLIKEKLWTDVDFMIVGAAARSDEEYETWLRALADEWQVADRVRFTGYVADLPAHLAAFDLIVSPSDNEAFSLALVEAMASGCAVIAARVGGMAEIVEDGVTGLFVAPDDALALASAMARLLEDESLRAKLGAAARASVRERFDRERVINQIEQLYQESSRQ